MKKVKLNYSECDTKTKVFFWIRQIILILLFCVVSFCVVCALVIAFGSESESESESAVSESVSDNFVDASKTAFISDNSYDLASFSDSTIVSGYNNLGLIIDSVEYFPSWSLLSFSDSYFSFYFVDSSISFSSSSYSVVSFSSAFSDSASSFARGLSLYSYSSPSSDLIYFNPRDTVFGGSLPVLYVSSSVYSYIYQSSSLYGLSTFSASYSASDTRFLGFSVTLSSDSSDFEGGLHQTESDSSDVMYSRAWRDSTDNDPFFYEKFYTDSSDSVLTYSLLDSSSAYPGAVALSFTSDTVYDIYSSNNYIYSFASNSYLYIRYWDSSGNVSISGIALSDINYSFSNGNKLIVYVPSSYVFTSDNLTFSELFDSDSWAFSVYFDIVTDPLTPLINIFYRDVSIYTWLDEDVLYSSSAEVVNVFNLSPSSGSTLSYSSSSIYDSTYSLNFVFDYESVYGYSLNTQVKYFNFYDNPSWLTSDNSSSSSLGDVQYLFSIYNLYNNLTYVFVPTGVCVNSDWLAESDFVYSDSISLFSYDSINNRVTLTFSDNSKFTVYLYYPGYSSDSDYVYMGSYTLDNILSTVIGFDVSSGSRYVNSFAYSANTSYDIPALVTSWFSTDTESGSTVVTPSDWYDQGYNSGYNAGSSASWSSPLTVIFSAVADIFDITLIGDFKLGSFLLVGLYIILAVWFIKLFAGG